MNNTSPIVSSTNLLDAMLDRAHELSVTRGTVYVVHVETSDQAFEIAMQFPFPGKLVAQFTDGKFVRLAEAE